MLNMLTDQGYINCFEAGWLSVELHILCSDCANHVVLITRLKRVVSPVGCAPREGPRRGPDFGAPVTRSLCSPCSRVLCSSERSTLMCDFRGNSGQTHAYTDIKTEHSHRSTMTAHVTRIDGSTHSSEGSSSTPPPHTLQALACSPRPAFTPMHSCVRRQREAPLSYSEHT